MRRIILLILLFLLALSLSYFYFSFRTNSVSIISPLSRIDLWFPNLTSSSDVAEKPAISARSAIVYDLTSEKVLFEKQPNMILPMASLTKIMTAVVAIDHKRKDDRYLVSESDLVGENSMGLTSGEILNQNELLHGLILASANDASEVLASNTLGRQAFIKAMNDKAKRLGLRNTGFTNPSGLEGDGIQQSTAKELLILTRFALKNYPEFAKVVATVEYNIPYSENHKAFELFNETNLLTSYPGVKGVKDGYTYEAGLCLVTYLDYQGHEIIAVILGSNNRRQEMKDLLDFSLRSLGITPPPHG